MQCSLCVSYPLQCQVRGQHINFSYYFDPPYPQSTTLPVQHLVVGWIIRIKRALINIRKILHGKRILSSFREQIIPMNSLLDDFFAVWDCLSKIFGSSKGPCIEFIVRAVFLYLVLRHMSGSPTDSGFSRKKLFGLFSIWIASWWTTSILLT